MKSVSEEVLDRIEDLEQDAAKDDKEAATHEDWAKQLRASAVAKRQAASTYRAFLAPKI